MHFRRRDILKNLAAAVFIPRFITGRARGEEHADVIIIGAGLSGLYAAMLLEEQGVTVRVLEAQSQVGGRMRTIDRRGRYYNCGATTLGPYYGRVRDAVERVGVELVAPPQRSPVIYHVNGQLVTAEDWESSPANLTKGDERSILPDSLEFPIMTRLNKIDEVTEWYTNETLDYDIPLDRFYANHGVSEEAIRLIDHISNTNSLAATSALFQMKEMARLEMWLGGGVEEEIERSVYEAENGGRFHHIKGGTQRLAEKMAESLNREVLLNKPAASIHLDDDQAEVRCTDGSRFLARYVIATVPYSVLRHLDVTPAIRGPKREAIWNAIYTNTTHVFFEVKRPYWEDDTGAPGLFTDTILERVFASMGPGGEVEWLDCWINGNNAARLDALPAEDLQNFVADELVKIRPSMKGKIRAVASYSWGNNPYVAGNKHVFTPGQIRAYAQVMAEPWGRLRFAGEHTRSFEAGLEAAAKSGEREALALLEMI